MNSFSLIRRSALHHWRANLGTLLAAAVGTAVLVGALLVGDSVRGSLRVIALERLGSVQYALQMGDRFFRADLAQRVAAQLNKTQPGVEAASIIDISGVCAHDGTGRRVGQVQVLGVEDSFWRLGIDSVKHPLARGEIRLNERLAEALGAHAGDMIRVRIAKPGLLPNDAPLGAVKEEQSVLLRAKVSAVIPDRGLGRFDLNASQIAPYNAFLPLADLQEKFGQTARANVLLLAGSESAPLTSNSSPSRGESRGTADAALNAAYDLDDAQIQLRRVFEPKLGFSFTELSTTRIFFDDAVAIDLLGDRSLRKYDISIEPTAALITYFINAIRLAGRETPYSMVTAATAPLVDAQLKDDEIVLNDWTTDDLNAKPGDKVELEYYVAGPMRKLETRTAQFTVKAIVPIAGLHADKKLMPDFPGIADVDSTHDWNSGIPIDMKKIRAKDEDYWKQYRGTPKAFISLKRGVELWRNRFGTYTALRFPSYGGADVKVVAQELRNRILPSHLGLTLTPVREQALAAADQATDFGGLFLGLSFFLILAAALLMALLFQFAVESRANETGLLLAVGFTPRAVRRLFWAEGVALAAVGSLLGVVGGSFYAQALLAALTTRWRGAVGSMMLEFHAEPQSFIIGGLAGTIIAAITIAWAVRRQASRPARELLASKGADDAFEPPPRKRTSAAEWAILIAAFMLIGFLGKDNMPSSMDFFLSGTVLLVVTLLIVRDILKARPPIESPTKILPGLGALGRRASSRHRGRSLATASLLACGTFLVVAVGANQKGAEADTTDKHSGTGGFALYAQSTLPIYEDLNTPAGRANAGVSDAAFDGVKLYALRVKAGDEASCLNLNRAQQPRIISIPETFYERGGFTFTQRGHDWPILKRQNETDPIPAVIDAQSLQWALHMSVGDEMTVADEHGVARRVHIAGAIENSIMQGSVMIAEEEFLKLFPSESGYRMFLIDALHEQAPAVAQRISTALQDEGFDAQPAARRLAEFNAVENTYLATFQALGGLGLLLGSLGLGVVVLRNMLERRGELAIMRAIGFSRAQVGWLVLSEHIWILALGMAAGTFASLVAVAPAPRESLPWMTLLLMLTSIFASGFLSAFLATAFAMRGPLLAALRND